MKYSSVMTLTPCRVAGKDMFVWATEQRHGMNYFNCAVYK